MLFHKIIFVFLDSSKADNTFLTDGGCIPKTRTLLLFAIIKHWTEMLSGKYF